MSREEAEILAVDVEQDEGQDGGATGEAAAATPTGPPLGFLSSVMPPASGPPPISKTSATPSSQAPTFAKATGAVGTEPSRPDLAGQPAFTAIPLMTGAFMPPPAVLQEIESRGNAFSFFLTYMGVTPDVGISFLAAMDLPVNEHYVSFLGIRDDEIDEVFDSSPPGKKYTVGMKSKIRMAFKVVRALAGTEAPPMPMTTKVIHHNAPSEHQATTTLVSASSKEDPNMIALSAVVLQTNDTKVKILDDATIKEMRARYKKHHGVKPTADVDVTKEQLTGLHTCVNIIGSAYVDYCLWVAFWARFIKKKRFTGMVPNEYGELQQVEIFGPPSFDAWETCHECFGTGSLMTDIICVGNITAYHRRIKKLDRQFPGCWAIIYQADVRMRSERSLRIKEELEEKHEHYVQNG